MSAALMLLVLAQLSTDAPPEPAAAPNAGATASETLKERLSDKASDEQRVNNCRVPQDRRGTKPRPDCDVGAAAMSRATGDRRPPR